ncbi:hypothetical protein [Corynebacterium sp. p3-SID1194]|uniref:hypothetical protein n=1 Tax=Corynebacterium sp. p3-SID1194 TaxID=2916105 RepID=UPI0021A91747|nr:hypothetical protein [Corynebacterium sp. p3-SID1194]MCT1449605.1 hypothetical protein [Corynebacterium sp. p3-SID1194]
MRFFSPALAIALAVTYVLRISGIAPDNMASLLIGLFALALIISTTVQAVKQGPSDVE